MAQNKDYTDGKLREFIASEVSQVLKEREQKKNWRKNEEFHSQAIIHEVRKGDA